MEGILNSVEEDRQEGESLYFLEASYNAFMTTWILLFPSPMFREEEEISNIPLSYRPLNLYLLDDLFFSQRMFYRLYDNLDLLALVMITLETRRVQMANYFEDYDFHSKKIEVIFESIYIL